MSNWNEDYEDEYEDDFENEFSSHSMAPSSVPVIHRSNIPVHSQPTDVALARGHVAVSATPQSQASLLASSFESYQSSSDGQVFAPEAHELSTPSSQTSSPHSGPTYTGEKSKKSALQSKHNAPYPSRTPAALLSAQNATKHTTNVSHLSCSEAVLSSSSRKMASQPNGAQRESPSYETSPVPQTPKAHSTSTSTSSVTHSDDSGRCATGQHASQKQQHQSASASYSGVPRDSTDLIAVRRQNKSETSGFTQDTSPAVMVTTPNTRDVSVPRSNFLDEAARANINAKKSIHQSNYMTVEELDDAALPQYKGRPPTTNDEELYYEDDANQRKNNRYIPQESIKQASTLASNAVKSPSYNSTSTLSSSEAQNSFAATIKAAALEDPKKLEAFPTDARLPIVPSPVMSDVKNRTAPYSNQAAPEVLRELAQVSDSSLTASTVSSSSSSEGGAVGAGEERAQLLLRIAALQAEIAAWDSRIERKRAFLAAQNPSTTATSPPASAKSPTGRLQRGTRSSGAHQSPQRSDSKTSPSEARRNVSVSRKRDAGSGGSSGNNGRGGRPMTKARLEALREKNAKLEATYARLGGDGTGATNIDVPALVARADAQLEKARARLKEATAARRALENRDKRAAHTIKEVHKRMPTATELEERQLNEGIYSRTVLQRTVKELRSNIERTRAAIQLMQAKCQELSAQVQERHLSSITPKEYEALCIARNTKKRTKEKHKAAIAVYSAAVPQDERDGKATTPTRGTSRQSSRTTYPRKSSVTGKKPNGQLSLTPTEQQALADYEASKAALLEDQQAALVSRKQELQGNIDELWRRIQQRSEQIEANIIGGGGGRAYAVGATTDTSSTAAGSGAVEVRKNSLRDVLRTPVGKRAKENDKLPPAPDVGGRRRCERNNANQDSAAAERLRGAVAATRKNSQPSRNKDTVAMEPPVRHSKPLPSPTVTGQRTVREAHQPSSSAFTALADSPMKKPSWDQHTAPNAKNAVHNNGSRIEELIEEDENVGGEAHAHVADRREIAPLTEAEQMYLDDDDSIEAMLRKIDGENKRIGEEVLEHMPQRQQLDEQDDSIETAVAVGHGKDVHDGVGTHDAHPSAFSAAAHLVEQPTFEDEATDEIPEEEVNVGDESGRSTPDWLRAI